MKAAFNDDPNTRLHACVRDNDRARLRELLLLCGTGELDLDYCDLEFGSALRVAVLCDNLAAADTLLSAGANPWVFSGSCEPQISAPDVAIQTGNRDIFIHICEKSVLTKRDENSQKRTHALLYQAALGGQASMVEDVLSWAHDWSQASLERALDNAVSGWHVEIVRLLLSRFNPRSSA